MARKQLDLIVIFYFSKFLQELLLWIASKTVALHMWLASGGGRCTTVS